MAEEQFLTAQGAAELRKELEDLISVKRPALAAQLERGDQPGRSFRKCGLSRRQRTAGVFRRAYPVPGKSAAQSPRSLMKMNSGSITEVQPGTTVTIQAEGEPPETYRIVGAAEADPRNGKISNESPMGSALLGRRKGDMVRVQTPGGEWKVTIKKITR